MLALKAFSSKKHPGPPTAVPPLLYSKGFFTDDALETYRAAAADSLSSRRWSLSIAVGEETRYHNPPEHRSPLRCLSRGHTGRFVVDGSDHRHPLNSLLGKSVAM
jgi:hypothetical protein